MASSFFEDDAMELREAFALALKAARKAHGLTQEDFGAVSSRTYVSTLERGGNSPTIEKVQGLAEIIGIHPLTILAMTYLRIQGGSVEQLFGLVQREIGKIDQAVGLD
ncbi:MAG: helix-turn-helix domain-containing protein [Actinomycetota bacterium]